MSKICVIGASRGLGKQLTEIIMQTLPESNLLVVSRSVTSELQNMRAVKIDLSSPDQQQQLIQAIKEFQPERVFYVAGGGPYGEFSSKAWKDHQWALEVSFLAPARILHALMQESFCRQFVAVGSAIAESKPDKFAASYAASKHALKGLIDSIRAEQPSMDVRLFSPGYMNTQLLPKNAHVRADEKISDPQQVAEQLLNWSNVSS